MVSSVNISYPGGGPNVTRRNKQGILYLFGDEFTNGSQRILFDGVEQAISFEQKQNDVFNRTGISISAGSLSVGRDLTIGAAASFIETFNPSVADEHQRALVPHVTFDDDGTRFLHSPVLKPLDANVIFGPAVSEILSSTIGVNFTTTFTRIIETIIHQVGVVGASEFIAYSIFVGTDNTGLLVFQRNLGAVEVVANQPVEIEFNFDMGLRASTAYFIEFKSSAPFSLKTDSGGNPVTTFLEEELGIQFVVVEQLVLNNNLDHVWNNNLDPVYHNQFQ